MTYVKRIEIVLAEIASSHKLSGLSTWLPEDFYGAARSFVLCLKQGEYLGITTKEDAYLAIRDTLQWDIPDELTPVALTLCLDELFDDFVGP